MHCAGESKYRNQNTGKGKGAKRAHRKGEAACALQAANSVEEFVWWKGDSSMDRTVYIISWRQMDGVAPQWGALPYHNPRRIAANADLIDALTWFRKRVSQTTNKSYLNPRASCSTTGALCQDRSGNLRGNRRTARARG